jgi:UPF0716 protein FxsA
MFPVILLLFLAVPAAEIYLLIKVGSIIGALDTFLLVLAMGVFGAYYARREGLSLLMRIQRETSQGRMPGGALIDGALLLVGGVLLITPGFITDVIGITFIFPPTRGLWKRVFALWLKRKFERGEIVFHRH